MHTTQLSLIAIDPIEVYLSNIEHQLQLWAKDSEPNRIDSVLKLEKKILDIEHSFKTNLN